MKEIVLLRHGHALGAREAGVTSDSERPLSDEGEEEVRSSVERLRAAGFVPGLIISSPFSRARRTAELAAGVFPLARRATAQAISDGPVGDMLELFTDAAERSAVLAVGHQPLLGCAAGFLLAAPPLDLATAGFIRIKPGTAGAAGALVEHYAPPERKGSPR